MRIWKYDYNGETIVVKNTISNCELVINGSVVDHKNGIMTEAIMIGTLTTGERVTAELRGGMAVSCIVHVDDILQHPVENN